VIIIFALGAIALSLVHLRRRETVASHEVQRLHLQQVVLRRKLWDQQVRLGYLTDPKLVHERVEKQAPLPEPVSGGLTMRD
jgi:hypothetical protein